MKTNAITKTQIQWRGIRNWAKAAIFFPLVLMGCMVRGQVTNVIYMDSFARTGQLAGTAPDTVNVPGAVWFGGVPTNGIVTDGSEAAVTNKLAGNPYANAWLPLNIETGHVYTVSCSILGNSADGANWLAMGFAVAPGQVNNFSSANVSPAWVQVRCADNACLLMRNGGTTVSTINFATVNTFMNYSLVLNTASNPNNWSETMYTNGVQVATYSYGNVPTAENGTRMAFVGLGESANARGDFKNFSVTDAVLTVTAPTILEQPNNVTGQVGRSATFWVNAIGLPDPTYQWMTNSPGGSTNIIIGATNATYTTPLLSSSYSGLNYSVVVSTPAGSTNSSLATLTVNPGQLTVFSATKTASTTNVVVMFSGPVDPATSLTTGNYALQVNGAPAGVSILGASAGSVPGSVVLRTTALNPNTGYYLAVQNVQDQAGDAMNISTNPVLPAGLLIYLRGDSGVNLDAGGKVVQWLDQTTNGNNAVQYFGMSVNVASLYIPSATARPTTGTIGVNSTPALTFSSASPSFMTVPYSPSLTVNGNQTLYCFASPSSYSVPRDVYNEAVGNLPAGFDFQLTGGGAGTISCQLGDGSANVNAASGGPAVSVGPHLWAVTSQDIATNALAANPSPVTNFTSFFIDGQPYGVWYNNYALSAPGAVYATKPLYIGYRQDHYSSAVMDGQMGEIMIYNTPLSPSDRTNVDNYFGQKYYSFSVSANLPSSITSSNGLTATYAIGASQGPLHLNYQWQVNGTNIPGANGQSYTTPVLGPGNSNTIYDVVITFPNGTTYTSATSTLTVLPQPPFVTSAGIPLWEAGGSTNVTVLFDEAVDPVTATTAGNYSLNGASVLSATMGLEPNKVILTTTTLAAWNANPGNYSLQVQNVKDLFGNAIVTASSPVGIYPAATALWLDASKGVTIDGGNSAYAGVNEWDDQSGNQDNLFQQNGVIFEPALTNNSFGAGRPTILFSGTNVTTLTVNSKTVGVTTFLSSENASANDYPALKITGDISVFAVANFTSLAGSTNGEILGKTGLASANQPAPYDYYFNNNTNATLYRGNGTNSGANTSTNAPFLIGTPHVVAVNELGNTVSHFVDGAPAGTAVLGSGWSETLDADQAQALQLGERGDYINRLYGSISELILIGQALDSNDVVAMNNYLISKYRIPTGTNAYAFITQQPVASTNVDNNTTLTIPVGVSGNPLALQWYDTSGAIGGQTSATLTIPNDATSDSYYLVAGNSFGSVTSIVVSVSVITGLQVGLGGSAQLYVGQPWAFTAQAYGNVPLYYQWYQGASPIPNATNATYSTIASLGATSYSCTVSNGYNGYTSTNAGPVTLTGVADPTNAFSQAVLSDGPVAYWRLNEPSGSTIAYDYVGGYNGLYGSNTTNGLAGVPFAGASGELGVAMDNTAPAPYTNGFINTPGVNLNTNTVTFLCWAYPFTTQTNSAGLIFYRVNGIVAGYQFLSNNSLSYNWNNNPADYDFGSTFAVPAGIWSLVAVTITPSYGVVYVLNANGQNSVVNNVANPSLSLAPAGFAIGADPQGFTLPSRIFNGEMDEAAIFNYALSASQLQQLYTAAVTGNFTAPGSNPTNIVFSVTNNQLVLSWPADHQGWQLQAQTNKTSVGISTNWVNYNPSTGTNQVTIPINLTNGTVFYRLMNP